jgi:hypothetical protein
MTPKRRVLNVLSKSELLEAGAISGIDLPQRFTVDQLCEALAKSKRATLDFILPTLSRDTLKAACLALGLVSELSFAPTTPPSRPCESMLLTQCVWWLNSWKSWVDSR